MPRRANTQTQQEAVQENAAVQADAGADMQMEAAITKTQPEKGVLALADVKIGDFMTIRNVRIKEDDYGLTVAMPKTKAGANEQYRDAVFFADRGTKEKFDQIGDADLIDHAVYNLDAAERRYIYLLKKAKEEGANIYTAVDERGN